MYFWTLQWEFGKIQSAIVNQNFNVALPSPFKAVGNKEVIRKDNNTGQYQGCPRAS